LARNGWRPAGVLRMGYYGVELLPTPQQGAEKKSYLVELPSLAPLMLQADQLTQMLHHLMQLHPGEPIHIAAHSAGGVVSRLALVRDRSLAVKSLITIAAPHLGTLRALQALEATDSSGPFGLIKDLFGGDLYQAVKHSKGALVDLTPARPGNLLYWLNGRQHPDIAYYSIVRTGSGGLGDELVPAFSQDMNNVYALRGKSQVFSMAMGHELNPQDGVMLVRILSTAGE